MRNISDPDTDASPAPPPQAPGLVKNDLLRKLASRATGTRIGSRITTAKPDNRQIITCPTMSRGNSKAPPQNCTSGISSRRSPSSGPLIWLSRSLLRPYAARGARKAHEKAGIHWVCQWRAGFSRSMAGSWTGGISYLSDRFPLPRRACASQSGVRRTAPARVRRRSKSHHRSA